MFTFRAHQHGNGESEGYSTWQAETYDVVKTKLRTEVALFTRENDAPRWTLTVGPPPDSVFDRIYVMNAAGKTVDTIR